MAYARRHVKEMVFIRDMDFISEMENKYPVDEWEVKGIHIWPLLRILIASEILLQDSKKELLAQPPREKVFPRAFRLIGSYCAYWRSFFQDFSKNASLKNNVNAIFLGNQLTRVLCNGQWYDRILDPIRDKLHNAGWTSVQFDFLSCFHIPRYNNSIFIQPQLDWLRIRCYIQKVFNKIPDYHLEELNQFTAFSREVNCLFRRDLEILENIGRYVYLLQLMIAYFDKEIKRVKPSIGFLVCFYSLEGMAFSAACRKNKVLSCDIQHGVQGPKHRAYGQWNRIPRNGYELLPRFFWVWSAYEANCIKSWSKTKSKYHQPMIGGNPWIEICFENPDRFFGSDNMQKLNILKKAKVRILFCLSGLAQYGVTIPDWLVQIIENSPVDWLWLFRLHPLELSEREKVHNVLKNCSRAKYDIDISTDLPLPLLMQNVDIHITHWSTTVIEAAHFGVVSIVLHEWGRDFFLDQVPEKLILQASDEKSFYEALDFVQEQKTNNNGIQLKNNPKLDITVQEIMKRASGRLCNCQHN